MPNNKGYKDVTCVQQGRPRIGKTRKVSITLSDNTWEWLDECVIFGHAKNMSELLRIFIEEARGFTPGEEDK